MNHCAATGGAEARARSGDRTESVYEQLRLLSPQVDQINERTEVEPVESTHIILGSLSSGGRGWRLCLTCLAFRVDIDHEDRDRPARTVEIHRASIETSKPDGSASRPESIPVRKIHNLAHSPESGHAAHD